MITPRDTEPDTAPSTLREGECLLSPLRRRLVELALSYVGCGVTRDRERYLGLVCGPGDQDAQMRRALEGASGCALAVRGLWRLAGVDHAYLRDRYRIGHAMADIETIARDHGAWVRARDLDDARPRPGDAVVLASPTGGHAFTVIGVHDGADRLELESVDGGQRDERLAQYITRMSRWWSGVAAGLVDHAYTSRAVHGWVDVDRLRAIG